MGILNGDVILDDRNKLKKPWASSYIQSRVIGDRTRRSSGSRYQTLDQKPRAKKDNQ